MTVHGMADRAVPVLDRAIAAANKSGFEEIPLQLLIAKIRALPGRAKGRDEARRLLAATLATAQKEEIAGARADLLNLAGQLAMEDRDLASAERAFIRSGEISKAADLPRSEAESMLQLSKAYLAGHEPRNAAAAIDLGIALVQ